ncbi:DUF3224 domain-containing protein [Halalkalibaculum sp. DA3122]|uniref:DUF3224 domain-containing protein n=1 Tax=unclassified Halalkalibaculum TaxID=2964617 RepID=UPI0037547FDC
MSTQITSQFNIDNWDEKPYSEAENGPALTRASVHKTFTGGIKGKSTLEYLMIMHDDDFAQFVGLEQITGEVNGRTGSFVLRQEGTYEEGTARADCRIVDNSGTGELEGISGSGTMVATHEQATLTLTCQFE